jgi:hypothetical protein
VETLLNLQSQLKSLGISVHEESAQCLSEQLQRVTWEQMKLKRKLKKVREQQSIYLPKRIEGEQGRKMRIQILSGVQQSTCILSSVHTCVTTIYMGILPLQCIRLQLHLPKNTLFLDK